MVSNQRNVTLFGINPHYDNEGLVMSMFWRLKVKNRMLLSENFNIENSGIKMTGEQTRKIQLYLTSLSYEDLI